MSRINDALKKISESDKSGSPPSAPPAPFAPPQESPRESSLLPYALGVVVFALGVLSIGLYFRSPRTPVQTTPGNALASPVSKKPEIAVPAIPVPPPKSTLAPTSTQAVAIPATNSPPRFPALKVQGIFLVPAHPQALVNGQTVSEGDSVAGAQIKHIAPDSVSAEWHDQVKIFHLNAP